MKFWLSLMLVSLLVSSYVPRAWSQGGASDVGMRTVFSASEVKCLALSSTLNGLDRELAKEENERHRLCYSISNQAGKFVGNFEVYFPGQTAPSLTMRNVTQVKSLARESHYSGLEWYVYEFNLTDKDLKGFNVLMRGKRGEANKEKFDRGLLRLMGRKYYYSR